VQFDRLTVRAQSNAALAKLGVTLAQIAPACINSAQVKGETGEVLRLASLKPELQKAKTFASSFNRSATLGTLPEKMFGTQSDDGLTKRLEV
jgi:hypothetical protein